MKWIVINDTIVGGAYRAAKNYSIIISNNYNSSGKLIDLYFFNFGHKESIFRNIASRIINRIIKTLITPKAKRYFTFSRLKNRIPLATVRSDIEEIVNIHWLGNNIVDLSYLSTLDNKIIVTMHDMWFLTGGCHLPETCNQYHNNCSNCPESSTIGHWRIKKEYVRKRQFLLQENVEIIVPSLWLKANVEATLGKECKLIRNPFVPVDVPEKDASRRSLDIRKDSTVIMMSAVGIDLDTNKARDLHTLIEKIMTTLTDNNIEFIIIGAKRELRIRNCTVYPITYKEQDMANFFNAADIFLMTSEIENLPYSIIEACYYGAFPIAYDVGGIKEIIDFAGFGKVVALHDVDQLINQINLYVNGKKKYHFSNVKDNIMKELGPDRFIRCIKDL